MGSKGVALLLSLNFLFFSMISSSSGYKPPPPPPPNSSSPLPPTPSGTPPPPPPTNSTSPPPPSVSSSPPPPPPVVSPPHRCPDLRICLTVLSPSRSCCTLLAGLTDLEAAVCLCARIKAGVIGISINANLLLVLLLNSCGKSPPANYRCN